MTQLRVYATTEAKRAKERRYVAAHPEAVAARHAAYHAANREKRAAYNKTYREKNKEILQQKQKAVRDVNREKFAARNKAWRVANPGKERHGKLSKAYNISIADYVAMLEAQGGACAICRQPETDTYRGKVRDLAVDHDHATGRVRALLCAACNKGLGFFKDNEARVRLAADYLRTHASKEAL